MEKLTWAWFKDVPEAGLEARVLDALAFVRTEVLAGRHGVPDANFGLARVNKYFREFQSAKGGDDKRRTELLRQQIGATGFIDTLTVTRTGVLTWRSERDGFEAPLENFLAEAWRL